MNLFGSKRFVKDITALGKMTNLTEDETVDNAIKVISRFGNDNLVGGIVLGGVASFCGMLLGEYLIIREKKKKVKELKETDK